MARKKSQVEKFREAAKEAETDDSEERFNATLKDMAQKKPSEDPSEGGQQGSDKSRKG